MINHQASKIVVKSAQKLHKKCPYSEFFWCLFSRISTEYRNLQRISPYSVQIITKIVQGNLRIPTLFTCAYQGVRNVRFFGKFSVLCLLVTSVLRFAHSPQYRQHVRSSRIYPCRMITLPLLNLVMGALVVNGLNQQTQTIRKANLKKQQTLPVLLLLKIAKIRKNCSDSFSVFTTNSF